MTSESSSSPLAATVVTLPLTEKMKNDEHWVAAPKMTRSVAKRLSIITGSFEYDQASVCQGKNSKCIKGDKKEAPFISFDSSNAYDDMDREVDNIDWEYFPGNGYSLLDHTHSVFATEMISLHIDAFDKLVQISGRIDEFTRALITILGECKHDLIT